MREKKTAELIIVTLSLAAALGFAPASPAAPGLPPATGRGVAPAPPVLDAQPSPVLDPTVVITGTVDAVNGDSLYLYRASGADTAIYRSKIATAALRDTIVLRPGPNEIWAIARDTAGVPSGRSNALAITYNKTNARIFPEVFRAPGSFEVFTEQTAFEVTVDLFTIDGERVVHLRAAGPSNVFTIPWKLTDGDGNNVRNGPYLAVFRITDGSGLTVEKHFIAVVR
jgi:hypothetical protein